jgi:cytochrome c peroxidase
MRYGIAFAALLIRLVLAAGDVSAAGDSHPDALAAALADYRRPATTPFPDDDRYTKAKADLGSMLFFDPILSGSGSRSCSSCHQPGLSWGDGLPRAIGEGRKPLGLRAPTLLNIAWIPVLGWDGKFRNLEAVTFAPLTNPANMNGNQAKLIDSLSAIPGYRTAFAHAFPDGAVSRPHIEQAIATFERTIVSPPAPFDRWVAGDEQAVSTAAKRGFAIFNGKGRCAECHSGWNFTDGAFYDIGDAKDDDIGRGRIFPTSEKLQHAFKTPTLRDVARRGPYMHDGAVATLADVIDLYDRGGVDRPSRSEMIGPLHLSDEEKSDLIAFLDTLTSAPVNFAVPELPR